MPAATRAPAPTIEQKKELPPEAYRQAVDQADLAISITDAKANIDFFESLPMNDRSRIDFGTVRGTQFLEPLFEFSGACSGCGETPYLKPPAAAASSAATCPPRPTPSTAKAAGRRGRTACSRTTPSSVSGSGSRPICTRPWPRRA